ncbi:MAG: hypothetical protein HDS39_00525 [Bacteroides sp.]|nr:hypothetical protein [Bacteroides sp.]
MNKKVIGFLLAVPALMGLGLTSCSDESSIADKVTAQEKLVNVTLTAQISNQTRASFEPDKAVLKFSWELEDEIQVVNAANGKYLGKLTVSEVKKDPRVCSFKGSLAIPTGKVKLNFFYLGKEGKASFGDGLTLNDFPVDFSAQNGEAHFEKNDILISTGEFENVENGNLGMINFDRDFAYGRFILKYNGEEVDLNGKSVTISANTGKLYNKASLNFQNAAYAFEEGNITVTPSTNDFYVSFFPTEAVNLKFVIEDFDGTKGNNLLANTYYTANTDGDPIVVEMRHSDGTDDEKTFKLIYDPNYTPTSDINKVYTKDRVGSADFTVQTYDLFAREGYEIVGWNTEANGSGTAYAAGDILTITLPALEQTLYAQWKENTYDWTIIWKDEDKVYNTDKIEGKASPATYGTGTHKPADPVKEGYTFAGWTYEGKALPSTITLTKDKLEIEIIAKWEKATYDLVVNCYKNDGTNSKTIDRVLNKTLPQTVTADNWDVPTRTGYKFVGWGMTPDATETITSVTFTTPDPINVYAIWKKDVSGGSIVAPGAGGSDY